MGGDKFELHIADETCEVFALYKDGEKVMDGEWINDYFEDILGEIGVSIVKDEGFLLGDPDGETVADSLSEIREYLALEPWERKAAEFEKQATELEKDARRRASQMRREANEIRQTRRA